MGCDCWGCVEVIKCPPGKKELEWNLDELWEGSGWLGDSTGPGRVGSNEGKAGKIPVWREFRSFGGGVERKEELTFPIFPCWVIPESVLGPWRFPKKPWAFQNLLLGHLGAAVGKGRSTRSIPRNSWDSGLPCQLPWEYPIIPSFHLKGKQSKLCSLLFGTGGIFPSLDPRAAPQCCSSSQEFVFLLVFDGAVWEEFP